MSPTERCHSGYADRARSRPACILRICIILFAFGGPPIAHAIHHMSIQPHQRLRPRKEPVTPLLVSNYCPETIWPGISTQSGEGPKENGFELKTGNTFNQTVSED